MAEVEGYETEDFEGEETEDEVDEDYDRGESAEGPLESKQTLNPNKSELICGQREKYDISKVPITARLTLRRKSALDLIRDQIPKPPGSIPRTALPSWYEFSMDDKIPRVLAPPDYIYFSRGKLGTPLHRPHPFYSVWDQRNLERVISEPYNPLHDPCANNYLRQPMMKTFLKKQGLINEDDEVLCSLKEFNRFRGYLKTQFNDEVQRAITVGDVSWNHIRNQTAYIQKYMSNLAGGRQAFKNSRRERAKQIAIQAAKLRERNLKKKERDTEERLARWHEEKAREQMSRIMAGYEKQKRQSEKYFMVQHVRTEIRKSFLKQAAIKDIDISERRRADQLMTKRALEKYQIEWIDAKLEYCKQRVERNVKLEEALRVSEKRKALKRQVRVEHYRAIFPALLEKKRAEERRIQHNVKMFAMRWLDKVRIRLNAPKDVAHESVWIGNSKGVLEETLKYLKELSGYAKMDDFVLNIIKLKRQIQLQIELEEAEERAAAAAAAQNEKSGSAPNSAGSPPNSSKPGSAGQDMQSPNE